MTPFEIINKIIQRIKSSDIGSRIFSGALWSFTGTAAGKFIVLIAGIVCARILGKEAYGQFGMVRSTINMFVVFGSAGLGVTATKYISEYLRPSPNRVTSIYYLTNGFSFITGVVFTVAILILSPFLAEKTLNCPELTNPIRIGALLLFVTVINASQYGVLAGFENFKSIAKNTFIASIAESLFMLLGAYKFGVTGAVLGFGIGFCVLYIANNISIKYVFKKYNIIRDKKFFQRADLSLLYKFSLPAALSSIIVMPAMWLVRAILVQKSTFGELGIYEAAEQWRTIILFIPTAVSEVVLPILSSIVNTDRNKYWKILNLNILLNGGITIAFSLIICILSASIMNWYGKGFNNPLPLIILAISAVFQAVSNVVGLAIASRAKVWMGFLFNSIWACVFVSFSVFFLQRGMGAIGVATALLISYVLHFIYQFVYLKIVSKEIIA